jgi:hypothetical protein
MVEHNKRVVEALNRYIGIEEETDKVAPHYAIMLSGEWGCGKTYFVRENWLKQLAIPEKYNIICVSVFGMKTIEELEKSLTSNQIELDRQKDGKVLIRKKKQPMDNKYIKGLFNITDKAVENFAGAGLNDVYRMFAKDWLGEEKEGITKVLILDDLERAKMDVNEIFGFISSYIESTKLRVILIGNEDEIKTNEDYNRIKEKLVGDTYKIDVDVDDALNTFVDEVGYEQYEKITILKVLKDIMNKLEMENLRVVRQSLIKLRALIEEIKNISSYANYSYPKIIISGNENENEKEAYIEEIMHYFLLVNVQKAMGKLNKEDITKVKQAYGAGMTVEAYKEKKAKEKEESKNNSNRLFDIELDDIDWEDFGFTPLTEEIEYEFWWNYIWDGELDKNILKKIVELDMASILPTKSLEDDILLKFHAGYWDYDVEEFYKLQNQLLKDLRNGKYTDVNAIIAAYAMLVHLADEKYNLLKGIEDIDAFFDEILSTITLTSPDDEREARLGDMDLDFAGYRGYQFYYSSDKPRVLAFWEKVKKAYKEDYNASLKEDFIKQADEVIEKKRRSDDFFVELTWLGSNERPKYYTRVPTLAWLGIDKLWNVLEVTSILGQRSFFTRLNGRYGLNATGVEDTYLVFKSELLIIEELVKRYENKYEKARSIGDNKVSMYNHLVNDAKRTYTGLKTKLEIGEGNQNR